MWITKETWSSKTYGTQKTTCYIINLIYTDSEYIIMIMRTCWHSQDVYTAEFWTTFILVCTFFKKTFCRTWVLFVGPLVPLFWTSPDICPGFQSQGGSLCMLSHLCDPQIHLWCDCIEVSMAAKPFWSTYLQTSPQALVEVREVLVCTWWQTTFIHFDPCISLSSQSRILIFKNSYLLYCGWGKETTRITQFFESGNWPHLQSLRKLQFIHNSSPSSQRIQNKHLGSQIFTAITLIPTNYL